MANFNYKKYEKLKKEIAFKSVDFNNLNDLFLLADVYLASKKILSNNKFPIGKYKKWKNK